MSVDRNVEAIYCDDIRYEMGNKLSFIGVYSSQMYVQELPTTIPKLCVHVWASTPCDHPFEDLAFKLLLNDDLLAESYVPEEDLSIQMGIKKEMEMENKKRGIDENNGFVQFQTSFVLAPFQIKEECRLRVRAYSNGEELKGQALYITSMTSPR